MEKDEIRKKFRKLRQDLDQDAIESLSIEIANRALQIPIWEKNFYHIFLSIAEQKEVDTEFLLHILQGKDKHVIISRSNFKTGDMLHFLLTDQTIIKKNRWNIPEPQEGIEIDAAKLDVVFIPLLAFDKSGHRVGYGKGFYDRFLAKCRPDILKVGLSFFGPVEQIGEIFPSDIPLNYCITPDKVYEFSQK